MFLDAAVFRCLEHIGHDKEERCKKIGWKYTKTSKNCLNLGSVVN